MNVTEAVKSAKAYVLELFADENLKNLGLEEVVFDDESNCWQVTVGFSRLWEYSGVPTFGESLGAPKELGRREYKIVKIGVDDGEVKSLEIRTTR